MSVCTFAIGSLAHAARHEAGFQGYRWSYARRPLPNPSADLGVQNAWNAYRQQYHFFCPIRDELIHMVKGPILIPDKTKLDPDLADGLQKWLGAFEECERLIAAEEARLAAPATAVATATLTTSAASTNGSVAKPANGLDRTNGASPSPSPKPALDQKLAWYKSVRARASRAGRRIIRSKAAKASVKGDKQASVATAESSDDSVSSSTATADKIIALVKVLGECHSKLLPRFEPPDAEPSVAGELGMVLDRDQVQHFLDTSARFETFFQTLRCVEHIQELGLYLMLHNDPGKLRCEMRNLSPCLRTLQPSQGDIYCFRVVSATAPAVDEGPPETQERYLLFDLSAAGPTAEPPAELGEPISSLRDRLRSDVAEDNKGDPASQLGLVGSTVSVFRDWTERQPERCLEDCLAAEGERLLCQPNYVLFRICLGTVITNSLFYSLRAEGPRPVDARDLVYHATSTELDESRINPYISLRKLGTTRQAPSLNAALTSASGSPGPYAAMIQSMGILLHEIGTWKRVVNEGTRSRLQVAMEKNYDLMGEVGEKYGQAVKDCLEYNIPAETRTGTGDVEQWLIQHVLLPLGRARDERSANRA